MERDGMYGWIWRHLPGNAWLRAVLSLALVLMVVYVLFQYVFPWAEPLLPFNDVTVDGASAGADAAAGTAGAATEGAVR